VAEQVRIDITADDQASKKLDQVADKVDDLESAKVKVPVDADTSEATRDIAGLMAKVDGLARDPANILLSTNAVQIGSEILDLTGQLDKLDGNDPQVKITVDQINALQGDLDQVEAKLRDINDVEVSPKVDPAPAKRGLDEIGKSADSSASVTANAVGNLSQDVASLGGIAGTAGVAFGQMGEYMTEAATSGERIGSVLANFGKQGALIGGVTLLVGLFTSEINKARKAAEDNAKQVEDLFKTLQAGGQILDAFRKTIEDTGKFEFPGLGDILPEMNHLNISVREFAALAQLPAPELRKWADDQKKLVSEGKGGYEGLRDVVFALAAAHGNAEEAEARHRATVKALGDDYERYGEMLAAQESKLSASQAATEAKTRADQDAADQLDRVNKLLNEEADALNRQVDAATSAADAQLSENDALRDYADTLKDAKANSDDVRDSAIRLAKAHQATAEAQAEATGQTLTATQKLDSLNDGLLDTAATAKGPARQGILDYVASVNQIPPEKLTEIQAAINAGDLALAKTLLDQASSPRTAAMRADADTAAANKELDNTANPGGKPRTAYVNVVQQGQLYSGGRQVAAPSAAMAPEVVNVTQYLPRGWRGDALGEARRAARRTGGLYARTRR